MTPRRFIDVGLDPALRMLPPNMDSREARAMIIAICLQESRLTHRKQIGGPARGYAQFETGGVMGVLTHNATKPHALLVCAELDIQPVVAVVYEAIAFNDVLMAAFSRLNLWWLPQSLPKQGDHEEGLRQYLYAWRPGRPHPGTFKGFFDQAWGAV